MVPPGGLVCFCELEEIIGEGECVSFKFKIEFKAMINWVEDGQMIGNDDGVIQRIGTLLLIIPILFPFLFECQNSVKVYRTSTTF